MEEQNHRFMSVVYKLYSVADGKEALQEEAPEGKPVTFISGFNMLLGTFEQKVCGLEAGSGFDFTLSPRESYGNYEEENVVTLAKNMFKINGHFDHDNIFVGASLSLQDEDGNRYRGRVLEITKEDVKVDLNHPLAGKSVRFVGHVLVARDATEEEVNNVKEALSGHHHCCCHHHHDGEGHCCHHGEEEGEHHCCHHHEDGDHCCCHDKD